MSQVSELDTAPETIEATLSYVNNNGEKIFTETAKPGRGRRALGRRARPAPHFDDPQRTQQGFRARPRWLPLRASRHEDARLLQRGRGAQLYYAEMEALVKQESGCERVVVFDHTLRTADDELREAKKIREVGAPRAQRLYGVVRPAAGARPVAGRGGRVAAPPLRDHPGVAADPPSGRDVPAGDLRRARASPIDDIGDRRAAMLSQPHRPDLRHHLQSGAPLVLVPAHAAQRGAGVQGVRLGEGRPRALEARARRSRDPTSPPQRAAAREHRDPHPWRSSWRVSRRSLRRT